MSSGKTSWTMEAVTLLRAFHFNEKQNVDLFYCSDTKGTADRLFEYRLWNPKIAEKCFFVQYIWWLQVIHIFAFWVFMAKTDSNMTPIYFQSDQLILIGGEEISLAPYFADEPRLEWQARFRLCISASVRWMCGVGPVFPLITLPCVRMWVTLCATGVSHRKSAISVIKTL